MRIIHCILGKANPDRMNGVNRVVYELATHQHNAGLDVEVWGITKDPVHNYPDRVFTTRLYKKSIAAFEIPVQLKKDIAILDPASVIFHLHGGFIPVYPALVKQLRKRNIEYLITGHGAYNRVALLKNRLVKKIYFQLFEKNILNHARYLHFLGKSETEVIKKDFPEKKIRVIPYGFNALKNLKPAVEKNKNATMVFGFCGRIDMHTKGLDLLLKGFSEFYWSTDADAVLSIIGDGPDKNKLKEMAETLHIEDKVLFHGAKFGEEKFKLMNNMDIFFHTSRNEGLPAAVLEACMLEIPCVLSEETNMGEYIRKTNCGMMLGENSTDCIASSMKFYYAQKQQDVHLKLNPDSSSDLKDMFSWTTIINRFETLYKQA